ncbi:U6 snRNA phosphodiesterase, partial [Phenoliferia sp. Uapishka_3]
MAEEGPRKKRKLPVLDEAFDESCELNGVYRAFPADPFSSPERGQPGLAPGSEKDPQTCAWPVGVSLSPTNNLSATLRDAVQKSFDRSEVIKNREMMHSFLPAKTKLEDLSAKVVTPPPPLHISISRPLLLQTNQRDDLRLAVIKVASKSNSFGASYASFGVLENDEKTRRFLGIELGAGYDSMNNIVKALDRHLVKMRLPPYYETPRFHTSIAWSSKTSATTIEADLAFSDECLKTLDSELGGKLRGEELWVGDLCLKVGKETTRYPLQ